jgi:hypothetical protein
LNQSRQVSILFVNPLGRIEQEKTEIGPLDGFEGIQNGIAFDF